MRQYVILIPLCTLLLSVFPVAAAEPTTADLMRLIEQQQTQMNALQAELKSTRTALEQISGKLDSTTSTAQAASAKAEQADKKIEATADLIEQVSGEASQDDTMLTTNVPQGPNAVGSAGGRWGPISNRRRGAAGRWADRTTIGGYGEVHYNNLEDNATRYDGAADDLDRVDVHRFVLFASHTFNDWIRMASELEFEHTRTGDGQAGEVTLELAWLEMDLNPQHHLRAGIDILPVGLLNLTHEPNTFYGVERNPVESEIIPSTWTEATLAAWGELMPGFAYNVYLHSGLKIPTTGSSAFRPRSGRLKVANADDQDVAVLGRIIYYGTPGLELAATVDYQSDYTGTADAADADAWLFETHADWRHRSGFGLRALYARWELGDDKGAGVDPGLVNADVLDGWYVEPAYRFMTAWVPGELGIFTRYQQWDERNGLGNLRYESMDQVNVGLNYWPHAQVVFKLDIQWQDADGPVAVERDGFNLGLGFQF
ncbi:MAG: hypothetical protein ACI915_005427 [Gammaproteobacteria bacterium]|jgi:hypothetical protein